MIVRNPPTLPPATFRRPSSVGAADIYGSYPTGVPTTTTQGTVGGANVDAAVSEVQGTAGPTDPGFLQSPVAVLLVLVAALAVISFAEP